MEGDWRTGDPEREREIESFSTSVVTVDFFKRLGEEVLESDPEASPKMTGEAPGDSEPGV